MMLAAILLCILNISAHFAHNADLNIYPFFHWKLIPVAAEANVNDNSFTSFEEVEVSRYQVYENQVGKWVALDCDSRKCIFLKRMIQKNTPDSLLEKWVIDQYDIHGMEVKIVRENTSPLNYVTFESSTRQEIIKHFKF